jgi:hypothetical protein
MSEEKVRELLSSLGEKLIEEARLKRDKNKISELIKAETEIVNLRREINQELKKISSEEATQIETEE